MPKYTTGEIAKLCNVSVRTVQYYDTRGILIPSELSEGGRRLYSDEDLSRMKIICFLRDLDFSINDIGKLLSEEHPEKVVSVLVSEQEKMISSEIKEKSERLEKLHNLQSEIKKVENFSIESIGDIAYIMKNKAKLRKVRTITIIVGIIMDIIEVGTLILWISRGIWLPFVLGMIAVIIMGICIFNFYYNAIEYICPECHEKFKPGKNEIFWAPHTPSTRKLTCPCCNNRSFCVETCKEDENEKA